jgi:hypothetical protein
MMGGAMKIKLLTSRVGAVFSQNAGDEIDVDSAEAARMIAAGQAIPVRDQKAERATQKTATEKAVR